MPTSYSVTVISANRQHLWTYLRKAWSFRSMIYTLFVRDLKVKYAQTALGILWTVLQPLTGLLIFTIFFSRLIKVDTGNMPYTLFAFTGMVSWFLFSQVVSGAGQSLLEGQHLVKRVYFPKLVLPLAKGLVGCAEFAASLLLLFLLMFFTGHFPGWKLLFFPAFVCFNLATALAFGTWLSALTIRYRDFHHIIPYLINFGIWLTPVFYPETLVPPRFHYFLYLNPIAASIAGFRWVLINGPLPDPGYWLSVLPVVLLMLTGLDYFRKVENEISDYL